MKSADYSQLSRPCSVCDMDIFLICIVAVVSAVFAVLLKKYNPEIAMLTATVTGIIIFIAILSSISPAIDMLKRLSALTGTAGENVSVLLKSIGICYICQFSADSCRDAGQSALAGKIELAGKVAVVLLCLPILEKITDFAINIIGG